MSHVKTTAAEPNGGVNINPAGLSSSRQLFRRAVARQIDLNLLLFVAAPTFLLFAPTVMGMTPAALMEGLNSTLWGAIAMATIILMISLIGEAFVISYFGNTPGKRLLGLAPRLVDGRRLSMKNAFQRGSHLFLEGYALTSSLLSFVANIVQAVLLKKRGETSYDRRLGTRVIETTRLGWLRWTAAWLVAILTLLVGTSFVIVLMGSAIESAPA